MDSHTLSVAFTYMVSARGLWSMILQNKWMPPRGTLINSTDEPNEFHQSQVQGFALGQSHLRYVYRLGEELLESTPAEKDFRDPVDKKLHISQ